MAPGRYVSYRNHEASFRQFDVLALRKKECYQDCSQRSHGCNQQKDGKQIDVLGRDYISGRNVNVINGEIQKVDRGSRTSVNCNTGELFSRNSSGVEEGVKISGDKDEASSGMKRKFSPTEWEMDGKKKSNFFNITTRSEEPEPVALPSAPHPPQRFYEPILAKGIQKSEDLSASFNQKASVNLFQVKQLENDDDSELMEEDYVPARTISFSRWADTNDSIEGEEGVVYDVNIMPNRRKIIHFASSQDQSPETGEVMLMEGSECSTSMASGSDGLCSKTSVESMEDGVDNLDFYREESIVEESDGLEEGCWIRTLEPAGPPCRRINMLQSCRSVHEFDKLNKINEGTYGVVYRAKDKKSGEIVALKKVKMEKEREGFPLTSLREINILLSTHHSSIVEVKEVVTGRNLGDIFLVMEYMEHDLKGLIGTMKKPFHLSEVKCLMLQLLAGVKHLHDNWVLHRDLKTSNLLFNNRGELKICDFGLSREYGNPLKPYTQMVVTLWYRAPELLLGAKEYSTAIDIWSLGCIMAELLSKEPLFPGKSELDQLDKIFRIMGTPTEKIWPAFRRLPGTKVNFVKKPFKLHEKFPRMSPTSFLGLPLLSDAGFDLLSKLLTFDPVKRITAEDAISHPWFRESPLPTSKDFMPTFPAQHMQDRCRQRTMKSPDPLEQLGQKVSQ